MTQTNTINMNLAGKFKVRLIAGLDLDFLFACCMLMILKADSKFDTPLETILMNSMVHFYLWKQIQSCVQLNKLTTNGSVFQFKSRSLTNIISLKGKEHSVGWWDEVGRKWIITIFPNERESTWITIVQVQIITTKIKVVW